MTRLVVTLALLLSTLALSLNLSAAAALPEVPLSVAEGPQATATPEPVEACPVWRKAGLVDIYICEHEYSGIICFVPVAGVMQCVRP